MRSRKGFVSTLEAVIAASLFLIVIVNVLPAFVSPPDRVSSVNRVVDHVLTTMERTGDLHDHVFSKDMEAIRSEVQEYLPGRSIAVSLLTVNRTEGTVTDSSSFNISVNKTLADRERLYIWTEAATDATAQVNGRYVINASGTATRSRDIGQWTDDGENNITIQTATGSVDHRIEVFNRRQTASLPDTEVISFSRLVGGVNNTYMPAEVTVFSWQ